MRGENRGICTGENHRDKDEVQRVVWHGLQYEYIPWLLSRVHLL